MPRDADLDYKQWDAGKGLTTSFLENLTAWSLPQYYKLSFLFLLIEALEDSYEKNLGFCFSQ